jgi:hypothetical protein
MTTPQRLHVADAGTLVDVSGHPVVLTYSSVAAEYEALRTRAIVVDRSHRARMRFTGQRAPETLAGIVTSDVLALEVGHGQYAAALTPKGKIVADVRIFRDDDEKNRLTRPNPGPRTRNRLDWAWSIYIGAANEAAWGPEEDIQAWLRRSRVNIGRALRDHLDDERVQTAVARLSTHISGAIANLGRLLQDRQTVNAR